MENSYELTFKDLKFFNYLSQFTTDTFDVNLEIKKLRKPYLKGKQTKDAIPEYKNYPETKDFTGDEIGIHLQIPNKSTAILKYIGKCEGKISFLYQVDKFLKKYSSFKDTYLKALLVDIERKESLSKDDAFIKKSFELNKWPSLKGKLDLKPEHYYCRLRNNFYSIHPDELFNDYVYIHPDKLFIDYGHINPKISFEFGIIMFYEFANFLLSKSDDKPISDIIEIEAIQVFQNHGFTLFKYLEKKYTGDNNTLPVKYSNLYHFLQYNQNIRGTQLQYITFIKKNRRINMSKVQPTTFKYKESIKPLLNEIFIQYKNEQSK